MGFWIDAVAHVLLPRACAHCRGDIPLRRQEPLCADCAEALPPPPQPACVRCAARLGAARGLCGACSGRLFACRLIRASASHRGSASSLVHAFKFRGSRAAARAAGRIMAERLRESGDFEGFDAVVPVPLHHRRERLRGYNQAELLAREIAASTGLPMKFLLARRRAAAPAWRLGKAGRQSELAGAFEARPESASAARGQRLLLIDDVCATGTTLEECAFALRRAGAVDVAAFVFARAGRFT